MKLIQLTYIKKSTLHMFNPLKFLVKSVKETLLFLGIEFFLDSVILLFNHETTFLFDSLSYLTLLSLFFFVFVFEFKTIQHFIIQETFTAYRFFQPGKSKGLPERRVSYGYKHHYFARYDGSPRA